MLSFQKRSGDLNYIPLLKEIKKKKTAVLSTGCQL